MESCTSRRRDTAFPRESRGAKSRNGPRGRLEGRWNHSTERQTCVISAPHIYAEPRVTAGRPRAEPAGAARLQAARSVPQPRRAGCRGAGGAPCGRRAGRGTARLRAAPAPRPAAAAARRRRRRRRSAGREGRRGRARRGASMSPRRRAATRGAAAGPPPRPAAGTRRAGHEVAAERGGRPRLRLPCGAVG